MNHSNKDPPLLRTEFSSPISVLIRGVSLYVLHYALQVIRIYLVFTFVSPVCRLSSICYSCIFGKRNYRVLVRFSVCVCVCVCLCVFLHDNSKRNRFRNTKSEYIVVYENSSDEFDIELHRIKVKVTVGVQKFPPLPQYKLSGPIVQFWYKLGTLY